MIELSNPNYRGYKKFHTGESLYTVTGGIINEETRIDEIDFSKYANRHTTIRAINGLKNIGIEKISNLKDFTDGKNSHSPQFDSYSSLTKLRNFGKESISLVFLMVEHVINHLNRKQETHLDNAFVLETQESHFWRRQEKLREQGKAYVGKE